MKNLICSLLFAVAGIMAIGFVSCKPKDKVQEVKNQNVELSAENGIDSLGVDAVERFISLDREKMFLVNKEYRWYETTVKFKNLLNEENDGQIESVVNVFQVVEGSDGSYDVKVYLITHTADGQTIEKVSVGFWVEDYALNEEPIALTFKEAFDKLMEANIPKPHSRYVVLREEIGPKACNPQYIFGNEEAQVYVDAVTGNVTDENPAFGNDDI